MSSTTHLFHKGDVLYGRLRSYLNKVWLAEFEGMCSSEFIVLPENEAIAGAFLRLRLSALDFVSFAEHQTEGDRPRVDFGQIGSFSVLLPPLPEQRRIVAKIEELFSRLDAGVEKLEKAKAQLKRYRQSVLKAAFEGRLTEEWRKKNLTPKTSRHKETAQELLARIREERRKALGSRYKEPPPLDTSDLPELPEGWAWERLGRLAAIETGNRDVNEGNPDGSYVFFTCAMENHRADTYSFDCEAILVAGNGFFNAKYYQGKFELYQRTYAIHDFFLNGKYLFYAVDRFLADITKGHRGSTIRYIRIGDLTGYGLPVPSLAEQAEIVSGIEQRLSVLDEEERVVDVGLRQAARLRQAILKRAFEGRLVPQDPTDPPASELLAQIKAEKAKREAAQPRKRRGR